MAAIQGASGEAVRNGISGEDAQRSITAPSESAAIAAATASSLKGLASADETKQQHPGEGSQPAVERRPGRRKRLQPGVESPEAEREPDREGEQHYQQIGGLGLRV